jgi:hypothetical protein
MKDIDKPTRVGKPMPSSAKEMWLSKDGFEAVPKTPPAETAQEAVHEVMPKADVPKRTLPA